MTISGVIPGVIPRVIPRVIPGDPVLFPMSGRRGGVGPRSRAGEIVVSRAALGWLARSAGSAGWLAGWLARLAGWLGAGGSWGLLSGVRGGFGGGGTDAVQRGSLGSTIRKCESGGRPWGRTVGPVKQMCRVCEANMFGYA